MKEIAPGVWQLAGYPFNAINVYVAGTTLIDSATKLAHRRIMRQIRDRGITELALTHAHADHQGSAAFVCDQLGIPLACHADDVEFMEGRREYVRERGEPVLINKIQARLWNGPPRHVDRVLNDGDMVGDFRVIHAPGHSPGEVVYFRDSDCVAISGDVCATINMFTGLPGIHEAPDFFAADRAQNHRSLIKLVELNPSVICPGHGAPLRDMRKLEKHLEKSAPEFS